jgi:hypothetical protein
VFTLMPVVAVEDVMVELVPALFVEYKDCALLPVAEVGMVVVCEWPGSVIVCVWLTAIASAEPPVSSAVSNRTFVASKPTGTRPAPNATQVPNPSNVPGLVALVALM